MAPSYLLCLLLGAQGQAIYAFVTLCDTHQHPPDDARLREELIGAVRKAIGAIATPDVIHWAPGLPKTRSGKIMRRILRKIASHVSDVIAGAGEYLHQPSMRMQCTEARCIGELNWLLL